MLLWWLSALHGVSLFLFQSARNDEYNLFLQVATETRLQSLLRAGGGEELLMSTLLLQRDLVVMQAMHSLWSIEENVPWLYMTDLNQLTERTWDSFNIGYH